MVQDALEVAHHFVWNVRMELSVRFVKMGMCPIPKAAVCPAYLIVDTVLPINLDYA